ncbi:hypothetical protein EZS27_040752, partial [termite gut metagenome]
MQYKKFGKRGLFDELNTKENLSKI